MAISARRPRPSRRAEFRRAFWVHRIGHGGELELHHRAGGLLATNIFSFNCAVSSPIAECLRGRPRPEPVEPVIEQVRLAVRLSELRAGDALMVASVSGRTLQTVELALAARALGVTVIGLTSLEYTAQVESDHSLRAEAVRRGRYRDRQLRALR